MTFRFKVHLIAYVLIIIFMAGCSPSVVKTVVPLSRENYVSQINPDDYKEIRGKRILFHGITDESTNTSNFFYYDPARTVGYQLYFSIPEKGMPQPLISFFWYALQKGFERAGLIIEDTSPTFDAELLMTIRSLTDREINFDVQLKGKTELIYEKKYVVTTPDLETTDKFFLEKRAYGMLDSIVKTVLDDPDFKKIN